MSATGRTAILLGMFFLVGGGLGADQGPAPPATSPAPNVAAPTLRVALTLERYKGASRVSSFPFELFVEAPYGNTERSSLRLDTNVMVGEETTTSAEHVTTTRPSWQQMGTDIDVGARTDADGRYLLIVTLQDSSAYTPDGAPKSPTPVAIRRLSLSNNLRVRDGEPVQFSIGTDPVTGETVKATLTATAVK